MDPAVVVSDAPPPPPAADAPPPPPLAEEVVPGAEVDEEQRMVVPAAAGAPLYKDGLYLGLIGITAVILGYLFINDKGTDPTAWWGKFAAMKLPELATALFLTVGDIASLGLIFSPCGFFRRMWTEGADGLAPLAPPLAGLINCGVWFVYGMVVDGKNMSVMVVNGTGVAFNLGYTAIYVHCSGYRRDRTWLAILLAFVIAVMIATTDYLLIELCGWKAPVTVGISGAITGSVMYAFSAYMSMMTTSRSRGDGGFSAQAIASAFNAFVWYALVQKDLSMVLANGVGMVCFVLQAVQMIYFKLRKAPALKEEPQDVLQRLLDQQR